MEKKPVVHFPSIIGRTSVEIESDIEGFRGYMFEAPDGGQVVFWECEKEVKVKPHRHDYDEYCLVVDGICEETVEGKTTILKKGDEIVIPAGKSHWANIRPNYRAIDYFGGPRFKYKKN